MSLLWLLSSGAALWGEPPATTPPEEVRTGPATEPADRAQVWEEEIGAITDLLIDGAYGPAKERAVSLLEVEDLPGGMVLRAQALLAKAAARQREAAPVPVQEPALHEKTPQPRQTVEIRGPHDTAGKEPAAATFHVRLAEIGGGFTAGSNGVLRLASDGLTFIPDTKDRSGWTIRWTALASAGPDDGLWDSPYPLAIFDRGGHKYFVTRIDEHGRYLPGSPILTAIAEARKKWPAQAQNPQQPWAGRAISPSTSQGGLP
jgi:hypothetical protein